MHQVGHWLRLYKDARSAKHKIKCSEYCILTFVWFPGVWILYADVSENSVCSIFIGGVRRNFPTYTAYEDGTECYETSAYEIQTPGNHTKVRIKYSEHGEILKSRSVPLFYVTQVTRVVAVPGIRHSGLVSVPTAYTNQITCGNRGLSRDCHYWHSNWANG